MCVKRQEAVLMCVHRACVCRAPCCPSLQWFTGPPPADINSQSKHVHLGTCWPWNQTVSGERMTHGP